MKVGGHAPSVVFVPFQVDDPQPSAAECLKACRAASGHPKTGRVCVGVGEYDWSYIVLFFR